MKSKPILLVAGEPKSIFLEIYFKTLKKNRYKSPLILICCKKNLQQQMKKFKFKKDLRVLEINEIKKYQLDNKKINLINIDLKKSLNKKQNERFVFEYVKGSFDIAFKLIKNKFSYKLINGPINKKSFLKKKFLGITEYISKYFRIKKAGMLIYNKELSVSPLTTHLPIKLVANMVTKKIIKDKINIINNFFIKNMKFSPKIGVTGLNPHCESVLKFNEDEKILSPIIKSLVKNKVNIKGPYPADTIFLKSNRKEFDVILGMYHDQVLTPLKTLFEYNAINITMGLPFLRISPDHGPNKKMFGKNKSNPLSLVRALEFLDKR